MLVEFWTFACINCQHVQPYVKAWSDRYGSAGLVVVGVHTPELSFERDLGNVREAVAQAGLHYPVAFDPASRPGTRTPTATGRRSTSSTRTDRSAIRHFGEGDYAGSEQVIRQLLAEPG